MYKLLFSLFFILIINSSFSQTYNKEAISKVKKAITQLNSDPYLNHALLGFCVMDVKNNKVLVELNSEKSITPASSLKIVTTSSALMMLGKDYRFKTYLEYDGDISSNGTLNGNIYIRGGGDPTLGIDRRKGIATYNRVFSEFAEIIIQKGIKKINGQIIADAEIFNDSYVPNAWTWEDMGNYYGAYPTGLCINENSYRINFKSGKENGPTEILRITPEIPNVTVCNYVKSGNMLIGDEAVIFSPPYNNIIEIRGAIPPNRNGYELKGSIPDPPYFCAYYLTNALKSKGVSISEIPTTFRVYKSKNHEIKERKLLKVLYSESLQNIVFWTHLKSINLYAENILKIISYEKKGYGNTATGCELLKNFWRSKGVNVFGVNIEDGSGLSRKTTITTKFHCDLLREVAKDPIAYDAFNKTLPVAGKSYGLQGMCKGTRAEGNMRCKSGYMTRIRSYAGYINAKDGSLLAFSIIVNNYNCSAPEMRRKMSYVLALLGEI